MNDTTEKIKCYKLIPKASGCQYDFYITEAGETWEPALVMAQSLLDEQFLNTDNKWEDIGIDIRCVHYTREEIDDIELDGN